MYIQTTATKKLQTLTKRIRGICGGTSASKTISILLVLINYAQTHENKTISVISESVPHLRRGAMRDFLNIMQTHNYFREERWNKSDSIYTFETNSIVEFFSADQPYKVKGPRRDVVFINEANHISYEAFTHLEVRTKDIIWLDWNPETEFWFYTDVLNKQDCDFVTLTYKDNEGLDKNIVNSIESRKDNKNWWTVYGEGKLGVVEGRIYKDWRIIDEVPHEAKLKRYGLDFGYSNDPTAIVAIYYQDGGYILQEKLYRTGMTNDEIAEYIKALDYALVKADSSEPKSIEEIRRHGITIEPVKKGKDSIVHGIQYVQQQKISVTKDSVNLLKEYRNYLWMSDKEGRIINEPTPYMDHLLDALRYGMEELIYQPNTQPIPFDRDHRTWGIPAFDLYS